MERIISKRSERIIVYRGFTLKFLFHVRCLQAMNLIQTNIPISPSSSSVLQRSVSSVAILNLRKIKHIEESFQSSTTIYDFLIQKK